ncbi:threonine/serine exporter family protein [uncultured Parvimonas sp.]|uniref:threonine/serine exporter family protein n=1 Tax=uncultured Parvimonas sp. TaxID=747372 RepID=UPI0025919064|nr:threonine/serine exporter family protein [uncultured Parvimonas sp.]
MDLFLNVLCAVVSSVAFSVFFIVPKKSIPYCTVIGTISWIVYYLSSKYFGNAVSNLIASVIVGLFAEYFSVKLKMPSTVFLYIGIVMLVPGYGMYKTMEYFAKNEYLFALDSGINTVVHACSIAIGVLISSVFSKSIKRVKFDRVNKINEITEIIGELGEK